MRIRPPDSRWLRYSAVGLLAVVAFFGTYFFVRVEQRSEELKDHYLKTLLATAHHSADELNRLVQENLFNAIRDTSGGPDGLGVRIEGKLRLIRGLDPTSISAEILPLPSRSPDDAMRTESTCDTTSIPAQLIRREDGFRFRFALCRPLPEATQLLAFTAEADLRQNLAPLLPKEGFDAVALVRADGTVLLQGGRRPLSLVSLPAVEAQGKKGNDTQAREIESAAGRARFDSGALASQIGEAEIAGARYLIFVQPTRLPFDVYWEGTNTCESFKPCGERENAWVFVGLKRKADFRAEVQSIPPGILLGLIWLFVLTLLAFPFLKIRYMGAREWLKVTDIFVLAFSLIVMSSMVIYGILGFVTYERQKHELGLHLKRVASDMQVAFTKEVKALDLQLRALTRRKKAYLGSTNLLAKATLNHYPHIDQVFWIGGDGQQQKKWSVQNERTALINTSTRAYFTQARDGRLWGGDAIGDSADVSFPGHFIQSIRSNNTGQVFAVLSHRLRCASDTAVVAAATASLYSVIQPVLPPGFGFSIVDDAGLVHFHSDEARNLREYLFDEVKKGEALRASILARTEIDKPLISGYWGQTYLFHARPLEGTPWSLVVFADLNPVRIAHAQILSASLALFVLYVSALLILLLTYMSIERLRGVRRPIRHFFFRLWPDEKNVNVYAHLIIVLILLSFVSLVMLLMPSTVRVLGTTVVAFVGYGLFHWQLTKAWKAPSPGSETSLKTLSISKHHWKHCYVGSIAMLIFVMGVWPPISFYSAGHDEGKRLSLKQYQLQFVRALQDRAHRHESRFRDIGVNDENRKHINRDLFPIGLIDNDVETPTPLDIHQSDQWFVPRDTIPFDLSSDSDLAVEPLTAGLDRLLDYFVPWGHELHEFARGKGGTSGSVEWSWKEGGSTLFLEVSKYRHKASIGKNALLDVGHVDLRLSSPLPASLSPSFALVVGILAWLGMLWGLIRTMVARIYFIPMEIPHPRFVMEKAFQPNLQWFPHHLVLRGTQGPAPLPLPDAHRIDSSQLRRGTSPDELLRLANQSKKSTIVVDHFDDGLEDPQVAEGKLSLLEGLVAAREVQSGAIFGDGGESAFARHIIVHSSINPLHYFRMLSRDTSSEESKPLFRLERWARVLTPFMRVRDANDGRSQEEQVESYDEELLRVWQKRDSSADEDATVRRLSPDEEVAWVLTELARECWPDPRLREIGRIIASQPDLARLGGPSETRHGEPSEFVIHQVLDLAEAYYQHLWSVSSKDEKLILCQICTTSFVSWQSRDLVRRLLHRGLIFANPNLQPMNESFRRFVVNAESPDVFEKWKKEGGASAWAQLKVPIVVALIVLVGFFFIVEPSMIQGSVAGIATLAAGVPAIIKLLSVLLEPRSPIRAAEGK